MGLRLHATPDLTIVTHQPAGHWLFGGFLALGGAFAVAMSLGLANDPAQQSDLLRVAVVCMGGTGVLVGLDFVRKAPASVVEFDRLRGEVRLHRRGTGDAHRETFPLAEVVAVEVVQSKDGDGDPMYLAAVRRANGERFLLSPVAEHHGPPEVARALAAELGLPLPA